MDFKTTTIGTGGRIVIPAEFRREIGAGIGEEVILRVVDGEIHMLGQVASNP